MKTKLTRITALFLAAALLLLTFAGCGKAKPFEPIEGPGLEELVETDKLVLYILSEENRLEKERLNRFTALYDVEVELVLVDGNDLSAYTDRLTNDLSTGGGPDIILLSDMPLSDITKIALNHNLLDLTNLMAEDPDIVEEDYLDGVFETGKLHGRQYMIPAAVSLPLMLSSEERLQEYGFHWENAQSTSAYLEELARLTPQAEENPSFDQMLDSKNRFPELMSASGISVVNYETGEVLPDEEGLQRFLEAYKTYFPYDYDGGKSYIYGNGNDRVMKGRNAFWYGGFDIDGLTTTISAMKFHEHGHLTEMIPGESGEVVGDTAPGMVAINAYSKNTANAWRFMKFLLSEAEQSEKYQLYNAIPVHKGAIRHQLESGWAIYVANGLEFYDTETSALTEEEVEYYYQKLTSADRYICGSRFFAGMVMESMLPYFRDEDSYKNCLDKLRSKLKFYLSE